MQQSLLLQTRQGAGILPPPFPPYTYQDPIIRTMVDTVLRGENGLVIQPTATGKSVEAAFTARACALLYGKRGLYLYDENEGLDQARLKFEEIFNKNKIVCANFFGYGKDEHVETADMVFASFQSLNNHHKKAYLMFDQKHFDYMIVNEGHHAHAVTYKEVIDYFICSKIGMTATPIRMDGKDILDIFDKVIFEMLLEEAIAKERVAQIEYHMLSNNLSTKKLEEICKEVLEEGKRISVRQLNESIFVEMLDEQMLQEVYKHAFPVDCKPRQVMFFCENIIHAEHVLKLLQNDGMSADVAHSKRSPKHNRDAITAFRTRETQFLLSVDKFNEDIDVPGVEIGVFLRATDSWTVFIQQLGRLLRKSRTKSKAIILDFVANCERLIYVQELVDKIQKVVEIEGLPFEKNLLHVSGNGFDFRFNDQMINVLKLLERVREGIYSTWQEASEFAKQYGFASGKDYEKRYKEFDIRLPQDASRYYEDFPGWDIYLGLETIPGWLSVPEFEKIICTPEYGSGALKNFLGHYEEKHPSHVKFLFSKVARRKVKHYSPAIVKLISNLVIKRDKLFLEGWKTPYELCREGMADDKAINTIANDFREQYSNHFIKIWKAGAYIDHYSPTLIKLISEELREREVPSDWIVINKLCREEKIADRSTILSFAEKFSEKHSYAFKVVKAGGAAANRLFFSPALARLIRYAFSKRIEAPEGWKRVTQLVNEKVAQRVSILNFVEPFRETKKEWIQIYWYFNSDVEFLHPDFVQVIIGHFEKHYAKPPEGWENISKVSNILFGNKTASYSKKIREFIEPYRISNSEWFKDFTIKGLTREHLHPDLVQKIKEHFAKKK